MVWHDMLWSVVMMIAARRSWIRSPLIFITESLLAHESTLLAIAITFPVECSIPSNHDPLQPTLLRDNRSAFCICRSGGPISAGLPVCGEASCDARTILVGKWPRCMHVRAREPWPFCPWAHRQLLPEPPVPSSAGALLPGIPGCQ